MKPMVTFVKSNLRNDIELINKLSRNVPNDTILTSFDITSLYKNIPHNLGIEDIQYWLVEHPEIIPQRLSAQFIIEGIKLILNNNTFTFKDVLIEKRQLNGNKNGTVLCDTVTGIPRRQHVPASKYRI